MTNCLDCGRELSEEFDFIQVKRRKYNEQPMIVLVNLISLDFLVRFQAPLAINVLAGYTKVKIPEINIEKIDMQSIFKEFNRNFKEEKSFTLTVDLVIRRILNLSIMNRLIVGMSLKWTTQAVAKDIIRRIESVIGKNKILFIIGNIGSTYGYRQLLQQPHFSNKVAVVGEGEDALVKIVKIACRNLENFTDPILYNGVSNVAINENGNISLNNLVRVDLYRYPIHSITVAKELYDEEYDFYALETSRGCPWGKCTFCAIKGQFGLPHSNCKPDWRWRPFPINLILKNIRYFTKQGVRIFDIKDSEFFGPVRVEKNKDPFWGTMARVETFAKGLLDINGKIRRQCSEDKGVTISHISARVDTIYVSGEYEKNEKRMQIYKLLKDAGLKTIFLGIESGSSTQLRRYNKGISVQENETALKIVKELGFMIEPGFIMFDPLVTMKEIGENLKFIERTKLYNNDSRILGSMRIQEGSPYTILAKNHGLLGEKDIYSLTYSSYFSSDKVTEIESTFNRCENITRRLVKLLFPKLRIEKYFLDFVLLKDLFHCCVKDKDDKKAIANYISEGKRLIQKAKENIEESIFGSKNKMLAHEYLGRALKSYGKIEQ